MNKIETQTDGNRSPNRMSLNIAHLNSAQWSFRCPDNAMQGRRSPRAGHRPSAARLNGRPVGWSSSRVQRVLICFGLLVGDLTGGEIAAAETVAVSVEVTSALPYPNTPLTVQIDFAGKLREAGVAGVLDPNSIQVVNQTTGKVVDMARTADFAHGDSGRIEWVIADPSHKQWTVRFQAAKRRPALRPQDYVPAIGTGDLLRFNAGSQRPITLFFSATLADLTGDGRPDLLGCWNYAYRPGDPWGGVIVYPALDSTRPWQFGDLQRVRYFESSDPDTLRDFETYYNAIGTADFDRDGRLDLLYLHAGRQTARIFLGTSRRQVSGTVLFRGSHEFKVPRAYTCGVHDLDNDGAVDLMIGNRFLRNTNPAGWPPSFAEPVSLPVGRSCCFLDLDGDQRLDAIHNGPDVPGQVGGVLRWQRNLGGVPPRFGPEAAIAGIDYRDCTLVAPATVGQRQLLIVQHDTFQQIRFFERVEDGQRPPRFRDVGRAESPGAVMSLSDQAWPCVCDWDDDGDNDLLIGGGYGWPRIVINTGTRARPVYDEPRTIQSAGKPIRFVRNEILGPPDSGHNMGYPYPVFSDWDGDGLRDLFCPNETNRLFWFRNTGSKSAPRFGPQRQVICDDFPDSPELRTLSATRAKSSQSNNGVYPREKERPFMWRTGNAIADFNGDGLQDFVTLEGGLPRAALFVQYRDQAGRLRLRRDSKIQLADGREVRDNIVQRRSTWGQTFRAVDWNRDGRMDLLYSLGGSHHGTLDGGSMYLLINVGTPTDPLFAPPQTLKCYGEPIRITNHGPHPWVGDFNHDGLPDLLAAVEWSVYPYYAHAALMMPQAPQYRLGRAVVSSKSR